jgi:glutamyl/glutaminyl-tRNA synthetase
MMAPDDDHQLHIGHPVRGGRTRLAPTPSGYLHAGNALNFLLTDRLARSLGARVLLRIDDLDAERMRPEYLEDIFRSLEWLGVAWDEGPTGTDDFVANWSQQQRVPRYQALADSLRSRGVLYGCDCSRSVLRRTAVDGRYPGTCRERGLDLDAPEVAWRLALGERLLVDVPSLLGPSVEVDLVQAMGDPVLRQRNGRPAYQLASLADDVDHGITFIVRGEDLLPSSACQLHIAGLLGLTAFQCIHFVHHPLLRDTRGAKLSKSFGATSLQAMRASGADPARLRADADELLMILRQSRR